MKNHKKSRIASLLVVLPLLFLLGGCATPSNPIAMTVSPTPVQNPSGKSVNVTVLGGKETSKAGASQIANADFGKALEQSILNSQIFSSIQDQGDYDLEAFIGLLEQPLFGASFTVKMEVNYTLRNRSAGDVVWQKNITSEFTATMGDTLVGVKRLRMANEGAARVNIEQLLKELEALKL